jgi:uncharacterized peroxidase-related enzyme
MTGRGFTLDVVGWDPWLELVDAETATPEQLAALEKSPPAAKSSPYFLTLAHDVEALAQRSPLFNNVMYAPKGLPRAERELATAAASIFNGCIYCTSVHARRFAELTKRPEIMQLLFDEGLDAELEPRYRAIIDFAVTMTRAPQGATAADLKPLRAAGLDDLQILDLIHAVAMFAWANRLMQTLGAPLYTS